MHLGIHPLLNFDLQNNWMHQKARKSKHRVFHPVEPYEQWESDLIFFKDFIVPIFKAYWH